MIGLKRNKVKITDHDSKWLEMGQSSCRTISGACRKIPMDIQHFLSAVIAERKAGSGVNK